MQVKLILTGKTKVNDEDIITLDYSSIPIDDKLLDFSSQENFEKSVMRYYNNYDFDLEWFPLDNHNYLSVKELNEYVENWKEISVTISTKI